METRFAWTNPVYVKVAQLMEAKTGLVFDTHRYADVETGARKTMARMNIQEGEEFLHRLETERGCLDELAAELTVGETYFFREPAQFEWIREKLVPEILGRLGKDYPLRSWSAGCSSGEEAYSLAILFEEMGLTQYAAIRATDISQTALGKARQAVYSPWSFRGREENWMGRYFSLRRSKYELKPRFRRKVDFEYLNLAEGSPLDFADFPRNMDLILCRNVLIYFGPATVEVVFRKLIDSLAVGGWLIAGPSDPLFEDRSHCEMISTPTGVFYHKILNGNRPAMVLHPQAPRLFENPVPLEILEKKLNPEPSASEILFMAQEAFYRGNQERTRRRAESYRHDVAARQSSIQATANCQGEAAAELAAAEAVRLHPLSPELRFLRAVLLVHLGRDREAVRDFRRTLYLDGTLAAAHFALGSVLRRLGDLKEARLAYENTLRICGGIPPGTRMSLSEGESANQLGEAARFQLSQLAGPSRGIGAEK